MIILGLDPGFAKTGWALMEIHGSQPFRIAAMGLLETKKSKTLDHVLASDDNFRRARKIANLIQGLCTGHHSLYPKDVDQSGSSLLCIEAMSFMRNAGSMAKVALAYGVVAAVAESMQIACVQASPQKIKKACNVAPSSAWKEDKTKKAAKFKVIEEIQRRYPETVEMTKGIPKTKLEHPYDAIGAIEACRESEIFITLLSMARKVSA